MVGWAVTVAWAVFISGDGGWAVACLVGGGGGLGGGFFLSVVVVG